MNREVIQAPKTIAAIEPTSVPTGIGHVRVDKETVRVAPPTNSTAAAATNGPMWVAATFARTGTKTRHLAWRDPACGVAAKITPSVLLKIVRSAVSSSALED